MQKYDLAIFDWDGVLADSKQLACLGKNAVFSAYHLTPPPDEIYLGEVRFRVEFYYRHGVPETATHEDLDAIWNRFFLAPENQKLLELRQGTEEALEACRRANMRIAIVSGNTRTVIENALRRFGLRELVDFIRGSANGKFAEVKEVLKYFATQPRRAFFVDDMPEGVAAARNAGVVSVAMCGGFGKTEDLVKAKPHFIINQLTELLPMVRNNSFKRGRA